MKRLDKLGQEEAPPQSEDWPPLAGLGLGRGPNPLIDLYRSGALAPPSEADLHAARIANLNPVQRAYLNVLAKLEKIGFGGASLRIYNDVVQRGRTRPITENDFTDNELADLTELVMTEHTRTGKGRGPIVPAHEQKKPESEKYSPHYTSADFFMPRTYLGAFHYDVDDKGTYTITDKYDFNADRGDPTLDTNAFESVETGVYPSVAHGASIGRNIVPDTSGRGVPVNIKLYKNPAQFEDQ